MLLYASDGEGGSQESPELSPRQSEIPKELQDKLEKLGYSLSIGTFQHIIEAGQRGNFEKDLNIAIENSSQKGRFETLYLKGFGQTVTINGRTLTFSAISQLPKEERTPILKELGKIDPELFEEVSDYLEKVASEILKDKKRVEQVANQNIEIAIKNADRLNRELQSSTDQIRSLSSLPSDTQEKAMDAAKANPPIALKGVPPEKYGEYKNLILAEYAIGNRAIIESKLSEADKKIFTEAIHSAEKVLGRESIPLSRLLDSKVLGPGRDQIESKGKELISSGYSKEVVWNDRDRTITFTNKLGETRIIETASIPPRERIERNGITISREIPPVSKESKEREVAERDYSIKKESYRKSTENLWITRRDEYENGALYSEFLGDNRSLQTQYEFREQKIAQGEVSLKDQPTTLSEMISLTNAMKTRNAERLLSGDTRDSISTINAMLERRIVTLEQMKSQSESVISAEKSISELPEKNTDTNFDSIARSNLSWLVDEKWDRMGAAADTVLDRIIAEMNTRREERYKISLATRPLDDVDKRTLRSAYEQMIRNLGYTPSILEDANIGRFRDDVVRATYIRGRETPGSIESLIGMGKREGT